MFAGSSDSCGKLVTMIAVDRSWKNVISLQIGLREEKVSRYMPLYRQTNRYQNICYVYVFAENAKVNLHNLSGHVTQLQFSMWPHYFVLCYYFVLLLLCYTCSVVDQANHV